MIDGVTMQDAMNQSGMTEAFTDHPISPETVGKISVLSSNYEPQYRVTGQGRAKVTDDWATNPNCAIETQAASAQSCEKSRRRGRNR